ncbi:MAG: ATPase [Treponema sp.]|nr:ATPase [Treponema sp.]
MAKTAPMRLLELMVLKEDISSVIEFIGKKESFQFYTKKKIEKKEDDQEAQFTLDVDRHLYDEIKNIAIDLNISSDSIDITSARSPSEDDRTKLTQILAAYNDLENNLENAREAAEKVSSAVKEANAFSNLKVSYSELDHLSFLSLKIGRIPAENYDQLKENLEDDAVLVPLGDDKSHVLLASSKKGRFALESILKEYGFVELEIPKDFMGVPEDVLDGLKREERQSLDLIKELEHQKKNFKETNENEILRLLASLTIAVQIEDIKNNLQSTELVYRITGWIPKSETDSYMKELDEITEGRIAIREFEPYEVPAVMSGKEQVPVKMNHGKVIKSFERMIFSYGAPLYGTIDPTPFVAIFFTILFGFMFGDLGQGLVFLLVGFLMAAKIIKFGGWEKFGPVFIAIGITSSIMGLLTGEFFSNETLLEPFSYWITGLFGNAHAPILKLMPSQDPNSIKVMFAVFGVAVGIGFIINSIGLLLNFINNLILKRWGEAFFGKNGMAGFVFYWYVVATVIRVVVFKHQIAIYDWVIIGLSLFLASFAEPFERALAHEKPLLKDGVLAYLIGGVVEVIEVLSGYLSNTVSFIRVGAFALSHAVLDYMIMILTNLCGGPASVGGIFVLIFGNVIVVVLEGMIVAIQVIRLQYYEFFSKFFHETGKEFKPFKFELK